MKSPEARGNGYLPRVAETGPVQVFAPRTCTKVVLGSRVLGFWGAGSGFLVLVLGSGSWFWLSVRATRTTNRNADYEPEREPGTWNRHLRTQNRRTENRPPLYGSSPLGPYICGTVDPIGRRYVVIWPRWWTMRTESSTPSARRGAGSRRTRASLPNARPAAPAIAAQSPRSACRRSRTPPSSSPERAEEPTPRFLSRAHR